MTEQQIVEKLKDRNNYRKTLLMRVAVNYGKLEALEREIKKLDEQLILAQGASEAIFRARGCCVVV